MSYNIYYSPTAQNDLDEIWEYISSVLKEPVAAQNTVSNILDKIDLLEEQPEIGLQLFLCDINTGYRYLVCKNYMVFYRTSSDSVYIDRVIYGKRDYMKILFG